MTSARVKAFDADLMAAVRARFSQVDRDPIFGERMFLDSGGGSLTLKSVLALHGEMAAFPDAIGRANVTATYLRNRANEAFDHIAEMMGTNGTGEFVFALTGTDVLFRIIRTLLEQTTSGDVVSSGLEHTATRDAAIIWAERFGRVHTLIPVNPETHHVTPEDYAKAVTAETALVTIVHTSNVTGLALDLAGIVSAVRAIAPNCFIVVDGIQHAPHGVMDVASYGVDAYVYAPYKAFCAQGVAIGWLNDRCKVFPHDRVLGKPETSWELGQKDPAVYIIQSAVHDYLCWLGERAGETGTPRAQVTAGMTAALAHERALIDRLLNGSEGNPGLLQRNGVTVLGGDNILDREGTLSFNVEGHDSLELVKKLDDRGIRTYCRKNDAFDGPTIGAAGLPHVVRISIAHYNTLEEMDGLLSALTELTGGMA